MADKTEKIETNNTQKAPLIRKLIPEAMYDWMLRNLPYKIMWVERDIDTQHTMWFPRWGYSKKWMLDAKKRAGEKYKNIKWE